MLMGVVPATPGDIERHTGRRPRGIDEGGGDLWRLDVGGRFIASDGVMYPSGVPYPEELHSQTAVIANEVWLYVDDDGYVLGAYWWPDAVRRPIASVPRAEYPAEDVVHPADASVRLDVPVPMPEGRPYEPELAVCLSRREVIVFCVSGSMPDPLNEMLVYEHGGVSVRARLQQKPSDFSGFLRSHQPPYRRISVRSSAGIARDPGRVLGPQTWPWPAELSWWENGVAYEVKGFVPVTTLVEIAESLSP